MEGPQGILYENKPTTLKQGRYSGKTGKKKSKRRIALGQGLSLYRGGKEIYKNSVKITVRERKGLKWNKKEYQKTIYYNIILARLILKRYIKSKGIKANAGKRNLNYSIVNTIRDKNLRVLRRPNKGRKYNSNTFKDRNNQIKRLALLGRGPSK